MDRGFIKMLSIRSLLVATVMLASAIAALAGIIEVDRPFTPVNVVGSLKRVNDGQVSPWDLTTVDPSGMIGAIGMGTVTRDKGVGDMISFAGRTFIRSTAQRTGLAVVEVAEPFKSPFMAGVASQPEIFPRTQRVDNAEPQLLHTYLEGLAQDAQCPIAVIGWVKLTDLDGTALKRAPIDGKSIFGEKKDDYLDTLRAQDQNVVIVAIVNPIMPRQSLFSYKLSRIAYDFDVDKGQPAAALIHVHGAIVDEAPLYPDMRTTTPMILEGLKTVTVRDVLHVYGTSSLKEGVFLTYRLNELAQ